MFASSTRPPFGGNTANTSFGFGTAANQNPFGQNQNMFGASGNTTFGAPAPAFGQTTTPMFGTPQQSAPLFGAPTPTPAFGTTNQPAFGTTNLFGQTQQPQANTSLFGATNTSFGQQNKPSGFNFPSSQPTAVLFGQTAPAQQQSSMFQPANSNIFGSSGFGNQQAQAGTVIKFVAITGTDSMQKAGSSTMINTKHHSITCMKEYESKSFEELRFEDYGVNRKGPQQSSSFGTPQPFGAVASSAPSLFGPPDNKPTFGTGSTFGQAQPFGLSSQPSTSQSVFGKPATAFGTVTTTAGTFGGFTNTASTSIFGANTQPKFGAQPTQTLFGAQPTQPTTGFDTGSTFFGQTPTTQQNFFNKPAQTAFSTPQAGTFTFGQTAPTTQTNTLFQTTKPNTGFGLFGANTTPTTGFGQNAATGFGTGFNSFAKPAPAFGQTTQTGSTFGVQGGLFGGGLGKPTFGTGTGGTLFSNTGLMNQSTGFSLQPQQTAQATSLIAPTQSNDLRNMINLTDPYGYQPHLEGLTMIKPAETYYVTNPQEIAEVLNTQDQAPPPTVMKKLKTFKSPPKDNKQKWEMYEEAGYDLEDYYGPLYSTSRDNPKRLVLKNKPQKPEPILIYRNGVLVDDSGENHIPNALAVMPSAFTSGPRGSQPNSNSSFAEMISKKTAGTENSSKVDKSVETIVDPPSENATKSHESVIKLNNQEINTEAKKDDPVSPEKNAAPPIDTCGIICTRREYYTIPPLNEISKFKNEDGTCLIQGFTIGRMGYGNVHFPELFDVSNINIDDNVHFRFREICVYTDDDSKPPQGEGLNRRAQVTLDQVFPKKIGKPSEEERDIDTIISSDFYSILKVACARAGTSFVDYRPETGSWVFNVQHFSKYGLSDEEEEECKVIACEQKSIEEISTREEVERKEKAVQETERACKRGLGGEPISHLSSEDYRKQIEKPPKFSSPYKILTLHEDAPVERISSRYMKSAFFDADVFDDDPMEDPVDDSISINTSLVHAKLDLFDKPEKQPRSAFSVKYHMKAVYIAGKVPLNRSLIPKRGAADVAMLKSRSFKVGWSRGFVFTAINKSTITLEDVSSRMSINNHDPFGELVNLEAVMDAALKGSVHEMERDGSGGLMPHFKPKPGTDVLKLSSQIFQNLIAQNSNPDPHMEYYSNILNLCVTLWHDLEKPYSFTAHRYKFNDWLENTTASLIRDKYNEILSKEMTKNYKIEEIMTCISVHKILKASTIAIHMDAPHLALLLSQLNANTVTRYYLQYQMNSWNNSTELKFMPYQILRLYLLGCGAPCFNSVNVMEGMDWLRCLGMYFWYIVPTNRPIHEAIKYFENAFNLENYLPKPYPIYGKSRKYYDVMYYLMKLYCEKNSTVNIMFLPATHTDDPTDYRLSWILLHILEALDVGEIDDFMRYHIITMYATQLESLGLPKWAVFVTLFIKDLKLRKNLVLGILDRSVTEAKAQFETEIVRDLHVPVQWIHYVKAQRQDQLKNYWVAYRHLAHAQAWEECHELAIQHLFPKLIANHEFPICASILGEMFKNQQSIFRWQVKGGLIYEFIQIWSVLNDNPNAISSQNVNFIYAELCTLIKQLKNFPTWGTEDSGQHMILAEVSKFTAVFFHQVLQHMTQKKDKFLSSSLTMLKLLSMPPDYKYPELVKSLLFIAKCL